MNQKTAQWLKSIKIPPGHINQVQLQNGYLFGLIFQRLNLIKDKKYKNSHDLACVFQNFKNTKDLLYEHFGIAFPANEIIYRFSQLLQKVKQACEQYEENKKQLKLSQIKKKYLANTLNNNATLNEQKLLSMRQNQIKQQSIFANSTLGNANRTFSTAGPKLPPKILQIEKKLSKYREQQTRHELLNLQTRKQQLDSINQAIQDHRYFEMSKLKMNQQMKKQFEKKVADVVAKTEEKKLDRIEKQQQFFRFMKSKKDNLLSSLRQEEQQAFVQGLEDFQLNCLRQGIQLEHDPNKPYQAKEDNFNSKVMLEQIKDNMKRLEKERKQRQKRANSKYVESEEANLKSQQVWQQNNLVDRLQKSMATHEKYIKQTAAGYAIQKASREQIELKLSKKIHKPLPEATLEEKEQFDSQLRANRLIYYNRQIERLEKKEKTLKEIARETLEALLYTVIDGEELQNDGNFTYAEWKGLQQTFLDYEPPAEDKRKKQRVQTVEAKKPQQLKVFVDYLAGLRQIQVEQSGQSLSQQKQLALFVDKLIEKAFPKKPQPKQQALPLYMPLRLAVSGNRLSGKTTQVKKLMAKYPTLVLIDPKKILTEAVELARPPPQNEDPKKKKDSKKPEEETPQKVQLKKLGYQVLAQLKADSGQQAQPAFDYDCLDFKYVVKAIKWKLLQSFSSLSPQQVLTKYNEALQRQNQRLKDFQKNQQQKNKKKDSKKGPVAQLVPELPMFNQFFYTEGFVLDSVELNADTLRTIERELNGFVRPQERLSEEAERLREQLGIILPIQKSQIPTNLNKGFFNLLIDFNVAAQVQAERNEGRKFDPQTGQVYHPKFNPHPTDVKGLAQRLVEVKKVELEMSDEYLNVQQKREEFYKVFGYEEKKMSAYNNLSECATEELTPRIVKLVEGMLRVEYETIKSYQATQMEQNGETNQQIIKQQQPDINSQSLIQIQAASCIFLVTKQLNVKQQYSESVVQQLGKLSSIRHEFEQGLLQQQRQFVQIITRPDDKANRILTFQDNYNKLLEEKSSILNDRTAISHLVEKLDELYDSLWTSIEAKKNQAVEKRKKLISGPWINAQVQKVVQIGKSILQAQLNYLVENLAFLLAAQLQSEGNSADPIIDHLCLGVPKQSEPIQSVASPPLRVSPRLQFYISQTNTCLQRLADWYAKKQSQSKTKLSPQLQQLAQAYITRQKQKISIVIQYLKALVFSYSEEQMCYFRALVNKMDDWIICGIKDENDFTYSIYKELKASIQKLSRSHLKDLFPIPITATIKPFEHLTHFHQPLPFSQTHSTAIEFSSFKVFLQELKCLCFSSNSQSSEVMKINFNKFKQYFGKRIKSKLLAEIYLRLNFDTMQQYLVTDGEANFRQVALALLLWDVNVIDEDGLTKYENQLKGINQYISILQTPSQLSLSGLGDLAEQLPRQQQSSLQHLIFDVMQSEYTHQVSIKEYIQILGSFNSLQLFKYGDSLMMLNHQKYH